MVTVRPCSVTQKPAGVGISYAGSGVATGYCWCQPLPQLSLSQSSACLLLFPTWTSPLVPSTSTGTGSAPTGPASSETPCSTGQPSGSGPSRISGRGCPGQGVGGALGPPGQVSEEEDAVGDILATGHLESPDSLIPSRNQA